MISFNFEMPTPTQVKDRLARGFRARRNFLVSECFGMIVYQTPVKTGRARGGWQISFGAASQPSDTGRLDPDGLATIQAEIAKLRGVSPFATVKIGNAVPYIDDLERGSSGQAPDGIVKVVLPAFRSIYADAE